MWQTVITVAVVVAAAAWVGRRIYRSLRGRGPACCGGDSSSSCAGCATAAPQSLDSLAVTPACPHCPPNPSPGGGKPPAQTEADQS
ncbi:MAG: FeoB-associated Cys-rich membrane protein [Pseudomonadota bacterium]